MELGENMNFGYWQRFAPMIPGESTDCGCPFFKWTAGLSQRSMLKQFHGAVLSHRKMEGMLDILLFSSTYFQYFSIASSGWRWNSPCFSVFGSKICVEGSNYRRNTRISKLMSSWRTVTRCAAKLNNKASMTQDALDEWSEHHWSWNFSTSWGSLFF